MRSSLTQEILDSLSLLVIDHDVTKQLAFDDIITEFVKKIGYCNKSNIVIYEFCFIL